MSNQNGDTLCFPMYEQSKQVFLYKRSVIKAQHGGLTCDMFMVI